MSLDTVQGEGIEVREERFVDIEHMSFDRSHDQATHPLVTAHWTSVVARKRMSKEHLLITSKNMKIMQSRRKSPSLSHFSQP